MNTKWEVQYPDMLVEQKEDRHRRAGKVESKREKKPRKRVSLIQKPQVRK